MTTTTRTRRSPDTDSTRRVCALGAVLLAALAGAGCAPGDPTWQVPQAATTSRPAAEKLVGRWQGRLEPRTDGGDATLGEEERAALAAARATLTFADDGSFLSATELPAPADAGPGVAAERFESRGRWQIVGEAARQAQISWATEAAGTDPEPPIVVAVRFDNDETFTLTVPDSPLVTRFIKVR